MENNGNKRDHYPKRALVLLTPSCSHLPIPLMELASNIQQFISQNLLQIKNKSMVFSLLIEPGQVFQNVVGRSITNWGRGVPDITGQMGAAVISSCRWYDYVAATVVAANIFMSLPHPT